MQRRLSENACLPVNTDIRTPKKSNTSIVEIILGFGFFLFFLILMCWFNTSDLYHRHFFDRGLVVFTDNIVRIGFLFILGWLIYAPGAALVRFLMPGSQQALLTPAERGVLAFGIGVGVWQVLLLILGIAGLYYRPVMIVLAAIVLLTSGRQFGATASAGFRTVVARATRGRITAVQAIGAFIVAFFTVWLLLARGLYPGGGQDYYNHYFPYYLEALKNHNLSPNDVWYHYYYSKGCGLVFLGMLLTGPEAPALVTFCCVIMAAMAMAVVVNRLTPPSLWPSCVAALYLAFNLAGYRLQSGGEFQKDHELVSALITMMACALCLARGPAVSAWLAMAMSSAVAAAIIAQPIGVLITVYFIVLASWATLRRRWEEMRRYGLVAATVAGTVVAMLTLNYWVTGLADDWALGLTLRFADVTRLDRWGVLPHLLILAWTHANNLELVPPGWNWALTAMLPQFMRLDQLWVLFAGAVVAMGILSARWIASGDQGMAMKLSPATAQTEMGLATLRRVGSLLLVFAAISFFAGPEDLLAYLRASSFFFPLQVMMASAVCAWAATRIPRRLERWSLSLICPFVLFGATLLSWHDDWRHRAARNIENGLSFFVGGYSLAEAYSRQDFGAPFGGLNPHVLAASRQIDPGTPIWSTNVESYCMAPGCRIESFLSFKMSGRLDEIVTAAPERSKQLLQEAGLNYFLISNASRLEDVLPYSELFAPNTIGRYLAIKWTDGTAFLLTWIGPGTTPLTPEFINMYGQAHDQPDRPWTRYGRLVPQLAQVTQSLRIKPWGAAPQFARRATGAPSPADGTLDITEATYGENCRGYRSTWMPFNTVYRGNASDAVRDACSGKTLCLFQVDVQQLSDPALGCSKDFSVTYRCPPDSRPMTVALSPEANGRTVTIACPTLP